MIGNWSRERPSGARSGHRVRRSTDPADGARPEGADTQAQLLRRLAVHLGEKPLGGGALLPALTDVIYDALKRSERDAD